MLVGSVRTVGALEGADPCVCPHVPLEVPGPAKSFTTETTLVDPVGPEVRGGPAEGAPGVTAPHNQLALSLITHDWQLSLLPLEHINLLRTINIFVSHNNSTINLLTVEINCASICPAQ
ncbi:hypothetical protein E2C01_003195 [Portunus trituberculatus]|uniref:Uncharacterized protein n=1 Tax=Portunus trituberculatus TaxID=210409 RepID=A0A5B7CNA3_PORTR|nr:hypothetical protein [Portunus trituberculatus]